MYKYSLYKNNIVFNNIAVIDKYLIIKDKFVQIFEIDLINNKANFEKEIPLQDELKEIVAIDINNIFLVFFSSFVRVDLNTKKYYYYQFFKFEEKVPIKEITSIYFNERITFMINDKIYYFGFLTTESGDLFLSKEIIENKDTGVYMVNCEFIKNFGDEIKHVQFKKFALNDKEYFVITVLTNSIGYYCLLNNINDLSEYETFVMELLKSNWNILYKFNLIEGVSKIYHSFHFDVNYGNPITFIALTDSLKIKLVKFSKSIDKNSQNFISKTTDIDLQSEIINSSYYDKAFKLNDIVGVYHYMNIVYVTFKKRIYLYNTKTKQIIAMWSFESETLMDLYIMRERKNIYSYYLFFLTNRNVLFTTIETNYTADLFRDNAHNLNAGNFSFHDPKVLYIFIYSVMYVISQRIKDVVLVITLFIAGRNASR